jgi:hypothetical protein
VIQLVDPTRHFNHDQPRAASIDAQCLTALKKARESQQEVTPV